MFVSSTIQSVEGLAHHIELRLTVPLKNSGMALPEHLGNEVIGDPASTEPRRERVTQLVQREIRYASPLQRASPRLLETAEVRLLAACRATREQIFRADSFFHLFLKSRVRQFGQRHVPYSVFRFRIWNVDKPVLEIHLRLQHRHQLLKRPQTGLRHDDDDVPQIAGRNELDAFLTAERHVMGLARRILNRHRKLNKAAGIELQFLLLDRHIEDAGQDAEFLMNSSRLDSSTSNLSEFSVNFSALCKPVRDVVLNDLCCDLRKPQGTENRAK